MVMTIIRGANVTIQPNALILAEPSGVMFINVLIKASFVPNKYAAAAVIPRAANIHKNTVDTKDLDMSCDIVLPGL